MNGKAILPNRYFLCVGEEARLKNWIVDRFAEIPENRREGVATEYDRIISTGKHYTVANKYLRAVATEYRYFSRINNNNPIDTNHK